jgi:hypothetical protein
MSTPLRNQEPVDLVSVYGAFLQLTIHGQENKWATLSVFLVFHSILFLGWATLFSASQKPLTNLVLIALCVVGILTGIAWGLIGIDYSGAAETFSRSLEEAERALPLPPAISRPIQIREAQKTDKQKKWFGTGDVASSRFMIITVPFLFAALYTFLIGIVLCSGSK